MNLYTKPQPVNDALHLTASRTNHHRKTRSRMDLLQANPNGFVCSYSSNKTTEAIDFKSFCAISASTVSSLNCINHRVFIDPSYNTGSDSFGNNDRGQP